MDDAGVTLSDVAPKFVEMAHQIVWCTVATTDAKGHPRTRVLHPFWDWDGDTLVGWIATGATSLKTKHLARTPEVSLTYWAPNQDTCTAEAVATMFTDDETCTWVWDRFVTFPAPVGYDPAIIPAWGGGPTSPEFGAMKLEPSALRVLPGMDVTRLVAWRR
jgi:general stress protein 26